MGNYLIKVFYDFFTVHGSPQINFDLSLLYYISVEIQTTFGETLSWDYLCYVRGNPVTWKIPTHILYGEKDNLTACGTCVPFMINSETTVSPSSNWRIISIV